MKLNQLSGRYLSLPVQYQRAHPALKEEVDLAVLVRGGLTLLQIFIFSLKLCNSRSIYSMNSDDSASHDSEEELDALELDQN